MRELTAQAVQKIDYEVWLVRDGATRGVWVSTSDRHFGDIDAVGRFVASRTDPGTIRSLVKAAQPIAHQAIPKNLSRSNADYGFEAWSLQSLCNEADVIVTGRVVGVLRNVYMPERASLEMQHTVYVVAVETDLKHDSSGSPALIKVRMYGGLLPGRESSIDAENGEEMDLMDPLLDVGARYCLFLSSLGKTPSHKQLGFVPTFYQGKTIRSSELDEYGPISHWRAKILLKAGSTRAPRMIGVEHIDHWRFGDPLSRVASGPQILDVPENEALDAIRQAVAH